VIASTYTPSGTSLSTIARESMCVRVVMTRGVAPARVTLISVVWSRRMRSVSPTLGRSSSGVRCANAVALTAIRPTAAQIPRFARDDNQRGARSIRRLEPVRIVAGQAAQRHLLQAWSDRLRRNDASELRLEVRLDLFGTCLQRGVARPDDQRLVVPHDGALDPVERDRWIQLTQRPHYRDLQ